MVEAPPPMPHSTFEKKIKKKNIGAKQNAGFFSADFSSLSAAC